MTRTVTRTVTRTAAAGNLNDLYSLDPAADAWEILTPAAPAPAAAGSGSGPPPSPRYSCGFAADGGGRLYVFGGFDQTGGV